MKFKNSQLNSNDSAAAAAAAEYTDRRGLNWNVKFTSALIAWKRWKHERWFFKHGSWRFYSQNMRTFLRTLEHFLRTRETSSVLDRKNSDSIAISSAQKFEFYRIHQNCARIHRNSGNSHRILQNPPELCWFLQNAAKSSRILKNSSELCWFI